MCINWNSHAPIQWKQGTLKNLIQRSISICSDEKLLEDELNYLRNMLSNDCNSIIKIELEKNSSDQQEVTTDAASTLNLHKHLKDDVKVMITYQETKLSSRFQVKDQTKFEHRNSAVWCCKCPENDFDNFYIGETDR